jgi:hypothetical protein
MVLVDGQEKMVPNDAIKMEKCHEFKGIMRNDEIETALKEEPKHSAMISFVRNAETKKSNFVLSIKDQHYKVKHSDLQRRGNQYIFKDMWFQSINDLIKKVLTQNTHNGKFSEYKKKLNITINYPINEKEIDSDIQGNGSKEMFEDAQKLRELYQNIGVVNQICLTFQNARNRLKMNQHPHAIRIEAKTQMDKLNNMVIEINILNIENNDKLIKKKDMALKSAETSLELSKCLINKADEIIASEMNQNLDKDDSFRNPLDNLLADAFGGAFTKQRRNQVALKNTAKRKATSPIKKRKYL